MLRDDATIDAGALYDVANELGMSDQQVRLCIKRLVADGQFVQDGRGRKAVLRATDELRSTIAPDRDYLRLMYAQDRGDAPWDGRWHVVAFAVPESVRSARDAMRDAIVRLGGAAVQGGLYVSPNDWDSEIASAAEQLAITGHVTILTTTDLSVGDIDEPRAIANRLWSLDEIAERHRRLLVFADRALLALPSASPTARLTIAIELAAEFTRAVELDPLLPPELLPQPWIGATARAKVAACWAELSKSDAPQRIKLFQWYAEVIDELVRPTS
ncbi:transcriptional regulator [Mycobacterium sp. CBMA293]|uniref:PaaX family transcriptional regulator C-terminal domain-containing protein n=1 Tax=unclassified Mycolicibacterium TaxID=2636767 RepID=UPI0012DDDEC6|nr:MULTISPECIES: PaaX family transcriptional regulator C-terminal domain-containing protein [unclassified Mycolicibacterium]MUL47451.1 transcriptional regulator [Mycolicibacterium sp. CBMA 360]MUL59437.1 transcriptional regulator [Mycolicibacterium sp. CBMA 335]MUL71162.1 transcriptional regulator [Mycolicibacterium sp. CBMA 311]MUL94805.1 transcriptional regulator [Mycolicibacterium sp. CBMA 230]MUM03646.1 transcriptional regulator [Mycolicibacterium sp. CBMA 213]